MRTLLPTAPSFPPSLPFSCSLLCHAPSSLLDQSGSRREGRASPATGRRTKAQHRGGGAGSGMKPAVAQSSDVRTTTRTFPTAWIVNWTCKRNEPNNESSDQSEQRRGGAGVVSRSTLSSCPGLVVCVLSITPHLFPLCFSSPCSPVPLFAFPPSPRFPPCPRPPSRKFSWSVTLWRRSCSWFNLRSPRTKPPRRSSHSWRKKPTRSMRPIMSGRVLREMEVRAARSLRRAG